MDRTIEEVKLEIEALEKEMEPFDEKISSLNDELFNLRAKENAKKIGKCYKSKNYYSYSERESDYWYIYYKIVDADSNRYTVTEFQITKYNDFILKEDSTYTDIFEYHSEEITQDEYEKARCDFMNKLICKIHNVEKKRSIKRVKN